MANCSWVFQPQAPTILHMTGRMLIHCRASQLSKQGKQCLPALPSPRARVLCNIGQCEKGVVKVCSRAGAMLEQDIKFAR